MQVLTFEGFVYPFWRLFPTEPIEIVQRGPALCNDIGKSKELDPVSVGLRNSLCPANLVTTVVLVCNKPGQVISCGYAFCRTRVF